MKGAKDKVNSDLAGIVLAALKLAKLNARGFVARTYKPKHATERLGAIRRELEIMAGMCSSCEKQSKTK